MLQSLKLRTDKLMDATNNGVDNHNNNTNNLVATTPPTTANPLLTTLATSTTLLTPAAAAAAVTATTNFVRETLSTPVAVHANGLTVFNNNSNNNNSNNHLNSIHHLQQYQAKYLESANAATAASASAAAASLNVTTTATKSFHPYLRPLTKTTSCSSSTSPPLTAANNSIVSLSTPTNTTTTTLFQTLLQNQINSTVVTTTTTPLATAPLTTSANTSATTASSGLLTLPTATTITPPPSSAVAAVATSLASNNNMENQSSQINPNNNTSNVSENSLEKMETSADDTMALVPCSAVRKCSLDSNENVEMKNKNTDEFAKDQPDADTIKMFVGQVPKSWDEMKLRGLFEQYGRVHTLNVLRDKVTMMSRGCCFVTYYTRKAALRAQDALHNIKILDGMHHPIQMKPADSENRNGKFIKNGQMNSTTNCENPQLKFSYIYKLW